MDGYIQKAILSLEQPEILKFGKNAEFQVHKTLGNPEKHKFRRFNFKGANQRPIIAWTGPSPEPFAAQCYCGTDSKVALCQWQNRTGLQVQSKALASFHH
jgi:hypothetical protein